MRGTIVKLLLGSVLVLSAGAQSGYAIPVSPIDRAIDQECATPMSAVKESRQLHQRCTQQTGGKESTKRAQCRMEEEKLRAEEAQLEKCKMVAAHNVIQHLSNEKQGMESAG